MTSIEIRQFLLWSTCINYAILIAWFIAFAAAHDWLWHLHQRWFKLPEQTFDMLHYAGMTVYKIAIMLFNLAPLLALCALS